jgi:hypothetical protein
VVSFPAVFDAFHQVALPAKHFTTHKLKLSAEERLVYDRVYKESK